jgi:hypothetical protein
MPASRFGPWQIRQSSFCGWVSSVDALRRGLADAQRRRAPATAVDLDHWVRARITVP